MRDGQLYQMHEANARRNAVLLAQFEYLETRQEALERVLAVSTLRDRIVWMFSPSAFLQIVGAVQMTLLNDRKKRMEEVAKKPTIHRVKAGV